MLYRMLNLSANSRVHFRLAKVLSSEKENSATDSWRQPRFPLTGNYQSVSVGNIWIVGIRIAGFLVHLESPSYFIIKR